MKNEYESLTERLVQNTISAFMKGYLGEESALSAIDFAAKLGDTEAQTLLDKCKEIGVAEAFKSIGK